MGRFQPKYTDAQRDRIATCIVEDGVAATEAIRRAARGELGLPPFQMPASTARHLARELRSFAGGQRGQGREVLESAAAALDSEAKGIWSPYCVRSWTGLEEQWFLVFDQQHGLRIAEHDASGDWIAQGGLRLTQVTHWRFLPVPPRPSV